MRLILADINGLDQHVSTFLDDPDFYRPERCPHCGKAGLWCHGVYYRNAKCEKGVGCSAPIPRFRCPLEACGSTCSVLPEYIPPRRWYHWVVQQLVFALLLRGFSLVHVSEQLSMLYQHLPGLPSISTVYRWSVAWQEQYHRHRLHLCNLVPELGRSTGYPQFWQLVFAQMPLSRAMLQLNQTGEIVP